MIPSTSPSTEQGSLKQTAEQSQRAVPSAPPSYYDFLPSCTGSGNIDELPAYSQQPRPFAQEQTAVGTAVPLQPQPVFTIMPQQSCAVQMHTCCSSPSPIVGQRRNARRVIILIFLGLVISINIIIFIIVSAA